MAKNDDGLMDSLSTEMKELLVKAKVSEAEAAAESHRAEAALHRRLRGHRVTAHAHAVARAHAHATGGAHAAALLAALDRFITDVRKLDRSTR